MKDEKRIEESIRKLDVTAEPGVHDRVLGKLLDTMEESEKADSPVTRVSVWRTVMKSRLTKIAAVVVVIVGVVVGMHVFTGSPDGASFAWADVQAAVLAQEWVHVKYDSGREEWHNLSVGDTFLKYARGMLYAGAGVYHHRYMPGWKCITQSRRASSTADLPRERSAWEVVVGPLEKPSESRRANIEKCTEVVDGRSLVRFDVYRLDAYDRKVLAEQLWADPKTRLPVRVRRRHKASEREKQGRDFMVGDFDFPETGPTTIYDLGAPAGLEIIDGAEREKDTSPEARQVIQKGKECSDSFVDRYRAVVWEDMMKNRGSEVNVIHRDGNRIRVSTHYFVQHILKRGQIDVPLTVDDILKRAQDEECMSVLVFDGERSYSRRNPASYSNDEDKPAKVVVRRCEWPRVAELQLWFRMERRFWPYAGWARSHRCEIVTDHPDNPVGCVAIAAEKENVFFVDPSRDYLVVGEIRQGKIGGRLQKTSETWWSDFARLPSGHWYPRRECLSSYANPERGTRGHEEKRNIDIQLLEEDEFPVDVFDGEKLLEGAEVETY